MSSALENNLFLGTLIVYFILNVINTGFMISRKNVRLKLILALLPFPLVMPIMLISLEILKAFVDFDNLPVGTDYGGYGTALSVLMGLIMMFFYAVNIIYLIALAIHNNIKSSK